MARLAAGIRKRPDGTFEKRFTVDGKRYSVYGKTQKECQEKEIKKREEIASGAYKNNKTVTLNQYFDEWCKVYEKSVGNATLINNIGKYNRHFRNGIGETVLCKIESREIKRLYLDLLETMKPSSVKTCMRILSMIFKSAVEDKVIKENPMPKLTYSIDGTAARNTIHRALTEEETTLFFSCTQFEWLNEMMQFLLETGMRVGEAGALNWSDVDYINNVIHVTKTVTADRDGTRCIGSTTKTKNGIRDIPLNKSIKEILRRQRIKVAEIYGETFVRCLNNRIFIGEQGAIISSSTMTAAIQKILNRMDSVGYHIDRFTPHAFRDTFATRAIERGMNPQTLKEIMGHGSFSMTMDLYAHVMPNTKQKEMEKVAGMIGCFTPCNTPQNTPIKM